MILVVRGRSRGIWGVWKVKLARFGDRLCVGSEGSRTGKDALESRTTVLFPEAGMLIEGHVWSGRSSCVGGAFEPSERKCQIGYTFRGKCVVFWLGSK